MASCEEYFSWCKTDLEVHNELMMLLVCDFLKPKDASLRFRMKCKSDVADAVQDTASVEEFLKDLEKSGKLGIGQYDFIKRKVEGINVSITKLILKAERKIDEIKANSLLVKAFVTDVEPISLEKETREEVDLILLAVSEKLLCRSDEDAEIVCGLWERYQDLNTLSEEFLNIWHTKFCKCRKQHGRLLLLKFIKKGAHSLEQGETEFDRFKRTIAPTLLTTLQKSAIITLHVFGNCGASIVSVVRSSVSSYWVFDSVTYLDKLWRKYEEEGLHIELQNCFNSKESLRLLKVDRISLKMIIQKSDYLKYRHVLEMKSPGAEGLTSHLKTNHKDPEKNPVEAVTRDSFKTAVKSTEGDLVIDAVETLKVGHSMTTDTTIDITKEIAIFEMYQETDASLTVKDVLSSPGKVKSKLLFSSVSMRKRMCEINKRLYETQTVISHILQMGDTKREPLYALASLVEYNQPDQLHEQIDLKDWTQIENRPSDIFYAADVNQQYDEKSDETPAVSKINSTYVFMLGEAGCGKTTYCLHLLKQWCQREDLQNFDYVFYVDSSLLKNPKTSTPDLICSSIFKNDIYSKSQMNYVLRKDKCLVLIDGGEYFKGRFYQNYNFELELGSKYCHCVFVFFMRPIEFVNAVLYSPYKPPKGRTRVIQLLGLDETGITLLYDDIIVKRYETKKSEHLGEIKKAGSEKRTEDINSQQVNKEADTIVVTTVMGPVTQKCYSDTQTNRAHDLFDFEEHNKETNIGDIVTGKKTEQDIKKYVPEYDSKEFGFYKIKELLENRLSESYDSIMKIPLLGSVCVCLVAEGKYLPRNFTGLYLCVIDELLGRYETFSSHAFSGGKGDQNKEAFGMYSHHENILCNVDTLYKIGNLAFGCMFSQAPQIFNYKILKGYLEEKCLNFATKTGLLIPVETLSEGASTELNVRFLHKSIQDTLVAMHIVRDEDGVFDSFCQQLTEVDVIIDMSHVIMMICGLSPRHGNRITKYIRGVIDKYKIELHCRDLSKDFFIRKLNSLQLVWYKEYKNSLTKVEGERTDRFYVSCIYLDDETDKEEIRQSITLLSDQKVSLTSLHINDVPTESDLSNKVLNDGLTFHTTLESIYISGKRTYRSIEPLCSPFLKVLKLRNVRFPLATSDEEAAKPLLSYLPMLQELDLNTIQLNKRLLGMTSDERKMPMLETVTFNDVDMGDQAIEFAPDMKDIRYIVLTEVKMSPKSWMKFISSLVNINHSCSVQLSKVDIDDKSLDMVRTIATKYVTEHGETLLFGIKRP